MGETWLILLAAFVLAAGTPLAAWWALSRGGVRERLIKVVIQDGKHDPASRRDDAPRWVETVARAATPLAKLSLPDEGWEGSAVRRRFMQAGLRDPKAPVFFYAIKTLLAFGVPIGMWLVRIIFGGAMSATDFFTLIGLTCAAGFYAPNLVLNQLVKSRQREVIEALPDALDLLTICMEAGLSLDAAIGRVAREIELNSPTLAEELQLLTLELRSGSSRQAALRNLALRTGAPDLDSLVAMLTQSEKFGTGMGDALRVYSGVLRSKRQARAEERAAKVAVKLIFPLLFCIFPAIIVVVGGPAMIRIVKILPTMVGGE